MKTLNEWIIQAYRAGRAAGRAERFYDLVMADVEREAQEYAESLEKDAD